MTDPMVTASVVVLWLVMVGTMRPVTADIISRRSCLLFPPPAARMALGMENGLKRDCEKASKSNEFQWKPTVSQGYQVATSVFGTIADRSKDSSKDLSRKTSIWFPKVTKGEGIVKNIANIVTKNSARLGGVTATACAWPESPATVMEISWPDDNESVDIGIKDTNDNIANAIEATEKWVDGTLCRLSLCPYTSSITRAAVGLESAKVHPGPVGVRHASTRKAPCRAAALAAAFWDGITEMATTPEEVVSTLLIVAPSSYDEDFIEFAAICDELLQPVVEATGADEIVGRAWFHPFYKAEAIGHETILPGHALPASMVQGFVDNYFGINQDAQMDVLGTRPDASAIAAANDSVRWTPHATINLLRRSQLNAAKKVEAASSNKRPNSIYVRNVMRILGDEAKIQNKG